MEEVGIDWPSLYEKLGATRPGITARKISKVQLLIWSVGNTPTHLEEYWSCRWNHLS